MGREAAHVPSLGRMFEDGGCADEIDLSRLPEREFQRARAVRIVAVGQPGKRIFLCFRVEIGKQLRIVDEYINVSLSRCSIWSIRAVPPPKLQAGRIPVRACSCASSSIMMSKRTGHSLARCPGPGAGTLFRLPKAGCSRTAL